MVCMQHTERSEQMVRRAAFTLMEMLVVVAIIVVLAGLGSVALIGQLNESKVSAAKIKAKEVSVAIDAYYVATGQYPPSLEALVQKTADGAGPFLKNVDGIMDPWGKQFQYDPSGGQNAQHGATVQTPDVFTTAPDGRLVGNWK
jgi:general secretion pathway protein G